MHPNDARHVEHLLPHHLRVWGNQVGQTLIVLDLHRSRAGRYRNQDYDQNLRKIRAILDDAARLHSLDVLDVDYSPQTRRRVVKSFFAVNDVPEKAWDGGPFYSYFFGLWAAQTRYVLHMDSDMLYGGRSQSWIAEAIAYLESHADVLFVAPLSGPPRPDQRMFGQMGWDEGLVRKDVMKAHTFLFPTVSTRIFFTGIQILRDRAGRLDLSKPGFSQRLRARIMGNPRRALEAETVLSRNMQRHGLSRVDMLGIGEGMWSLHPPYRSETFYLALPKLINRIETGDVPKAQLGHYNVDDSLVDWSAQRRENVKFRRWLRHSSLVAKQMIERRIWHPDQVNN